MHGGSSGIETALAKWLRIAPISTEGHRSENLENTSKENICMFSAWSNSKQGVDRNVLL